MNQTSGPAKKPAGAVMMRTGGVPPQTRPIEKRPLSRRPATCLDGRTGWISASPLRRKFAAEADVRGIASGRRPGDRISASRQAHRASRICCCTPDRLGHV